jgi:hypothetical protein
VDLLDGTPIIDIKPYIAYADSIPAALGGWAAEPIQRTPVEFSSQAEMRLAEIIANDQSGRHAGLRELIVEMLEIDPRPAFQKRRMPPGHPDAEGTRFGFNLLDFDVKWEIRGHSFVVLDIPQMASGLKIRSEGDAGANSN